MQHRMTRTGNAAHDFTPPLYNKTQYINGYICTCPAFSIKAAY